MWLNVKGPGDTSAGLDGLAVHEDFEDFLAAGIGRYDAAVSEADVGLATLIDSLTSRGLIDDTVLLVVANHGQELGDRGGWGHGHANLHAELTHVPAVMSWPGGLPAGRSVPGLAGGVDILPTLCEVAGLPSPDGLDGRSLLPGILDTSAIRRDTRVFLDRAARVPDHGGLRTEWLLYTWGPGGTDNQLFDLLFDADEVDNLLEHDPERDGIDNLTPDYHVALDEFTEEESEHAER
jgi:arylsulfatase A-like enzyme